MCALEVVVRNPRIQVVHVMQADVAREEPEHPRQLEVRASPQRRVGVFPAARALPVGLLELVLHVEQPDACGAGEKRRRRPHEHVIPPANEPAERPDDEGQRDVRRHHATAHTRPGRA